MYKNVMDVVQGNVLMLDFVNYYVVVVIYYFLLFFDVLCLGFFIDWGINFI